MKTIELMYNILLNTTRTDGSTNGIAIAFITCTLLFTAFAVLEYKLNNTNSNY